MILKRFLAIFCAFAVLLGGCGKDDSAPENPEDASSVSESEESVPEESVPEESEQESSDEGSKEEPETSGDTSSAGGESSGDGASGGEESTPVPEQPKSPPRVSLSNRIIELGEVLVLHISNVESSEVVADTDLPHNSLFYPDGDGLTVLLPISYNEAPGNYTLSIQARDKTFDYTIMVVDREFEVQNLTISEDTVGATDTAEANQEWEQKIEPLKMLASPDKYWEGPFMQPVQREITTEFGSIRYTNGSASSTRHSGIDIAAAQGTSIAAANNGKILFADFLQLTGNTVVIDHGFGLKSFYYHMDSLNVKEGDMVQTGDIVGTVGSTGYSTGPHLHYSLLVNNVFINPWPAVEHGI